MQHTKIGDASPDFPSFFRRCGRMVNVDRVKRELPSLLCDGETGGGTNDNKFKKHRYRLARFFGAGMKPLF